MTRMAETPMPQRRGSPGDKGVCWREAQWVQWSGAIAPDDLGPRRKSLHRTTSRVKLNRAIIIGSFLIICGETRTLLRRKAGDNSVEPVAVTGRIEPLPTIIDEGVGYRGTRTCERVVD